MKTSVQFKLPITLSGKVVQGSGDGRKLGFHTANIDSTALISLDYGVYACFIKLPGNNNQLLGVLHWGPRSIFAEINPKLEVHILNFNQDIYGTSIEMEIVTYIRPTIKFDSTAELTEQIKLDCKAASEFLLKYKH